MHLINANSNCSNPHMTIEGDCIPERIQTTRCNKLLHAVICLNVILTKPVINFMISKGNFFYE